MIDIEKYVNYITDYKITEHQFLILWLVHSKDTDSISKYKKTFGDFNVDEVEELIEKGFIDDFGLVKDNKRTFNIFDFIVTDKFTRTVYIDTFDAGDQLIEVYPSWCYINNTKVSAKSCDHDELINKYGSIIKNNRHLHQDIIKLVERMKQENNNIAPMGIEKFVKSRHWKLLEEEYGNNTFTGDLIKDI